MNVEIATERLRLRSLTPDDAARIRTLAGDLAVSRWLSPVPHPYPEGEAERFIAACLEADNDVWAIERQNEPGLIGIVATDGPHGKPLLGYWLGRPFWGRGYASEAVRAAVDRAFRKSEIGVLVSGIFKGNAASLRIQEKLGFCVTGQRMVHCRALARDVAHTDTALSRADWKAAS